MKKQLYELLFSNNTRIGRVVQICIIVLIVLNVLAVILETVDSFAIKYIQFLNMFEVVCVILFTIEYILRLYSCNYEKESRIKWMIYPLSIIDVLAIIPFYIPLLIPIDLRFIRILRLFRIFRILKLARHNEALRVLGTVFKKVADQLVIVFFCLSILLIIASTIMYHAEHDAQPEVFSSIPASLWWGVATLTTVGYGDIYPITILGKICSSCVTLLAVGLFALPTAIISSGFIEIVQSKKK